MSLQSILVLVIIFVLLGVAIGFIANSEKGWHGGCTGNCASCQEPAQAAVMSRPKETAV